MNLRKVLDNKSIDHLELSMRGSRELFNLGISRIGQLLDHSRGELKILGISDKLLDLIEEELARFNLSLK